MRRIKPQELFEEKEYIPIEKNDLTKLIKQLDKIWMYNFYIRILCNLYDVIQFIAEPQ